VTLLILLQGLSQGSGLNKQALPAQPAFSRFLRGLGGPKTVGTFVGTTASNRKDQRATMSKVSQWSVSANCLGVSRLERSLTAMGNRVPNPAIRFSLLRRQVLYPPELRARV
jgi:hypothetical protein